MIIVPIEEDHVALDSATNAKFRTPDYSGSGLEVLGAGLAGVGESRGQLAGTLDEQRRRELVAAIAATHLDETHARNIDDAAAKKAYVEYSDSAAQLLRGEDGLLNRGGADAHALFPDTVKNLADAQDAALASLSKDQHRVVAPALTDRLWRDIALAGAHVRKEGANEQLQQSKALLETAARDAVAHIDDPDLHDHHMATGENAIRQQGAIANLPKNEIDRQIADYRSGVHAASIDALTMRDPIRAAAWYARHGDSLNDRDKDSVEATLGLALSRTQTGADSDAARATDPAVGARAADEATPFTASRESYDNGDTRAAVVPDDLDGHLGLSTYSPLREATRPGLTRAAFILSNEGGALDVAEDDDDSPPVDQNPGHSRNLDDIMREIAGPRPPVPPKPAHGQTVPVKGGSAPATPAGSLQRSWPIPGYWGRKAGQTPLGGDRDDHDVAYSDGSFHLRPPFKRGKAHKGDDLPGPVNVPVHAAADGVVVAILTQPKRIWDWARDRNGKLLLRKEKPYKVRTAVPGSMDGYGHYIKIRHPDGYTTLYGHLRDVPPLKVGMRVTMGQQIGILGKTGNAAKKGSHVHFEVQGKSGHPIDPALWISGRAPLIK